MESTGADIDDPGGIDIPQDGIYVQSSSSIQTDQLSGVNRHVRGTYSVPAVQPWSPRSPNFPLTGHSGGYDPYGGDPSQSTYNVDPYRIQKETTYPFRPTGYSQPTGPLIMSQGLSDRSSGASWDQDRIMTSGGTTYFYTDLPEVVTYNPYIMSPSLGLVPAQNNHREVHSYFMCEDLRQEFLKQSRICLAQLDPEDHMSKFLPTTVGMRYHSLFPLDPIDQEKTMDLYGHVVWVYKTMNSVDALPYAIWRVEGLQIVRESSYAVLDAWRSLSHPNVVSLREFFPSSEFRDSSMIFVYDYHPGAITLEQELLGMSQTQSFMTEDQLWSNLIQLISALQAIHKANLACQVLYPSKVIITNKGRIRITGTGILDLIQKDADQDIDISLEALQKQDMMHLGYLMLAMVYRLPSPEQLEEGLDFFEQHFSIELSGFVRDLCLGNLYCVDQFFEYPEFAQRVLQDTIFLHEFSDLLEKEFIKEVESARLFRLCTKLGFIQERSDMGRWSEQGERYFLNLFRDHLFHRTDSKGNPVIDLPHLIENLSKLDSGSQEPLLLTGRNEKTFTVVSYEELKRILDNSYQELELLSNKPPSHY